MPGCALHLFLYPAGLRGKAMPLLVLPTSGLSDAEPPHACRRTMARQSFRTSTAACRLVFFSQACSAWQRCLCTLLKAIVLDGLHVNDGPAVWEDCSAMGGSDLAGV